MSLARDDVAAMRRAILAAYPDGGPLRNRVRSRRLRRSALRRLVAEVPASGTILVTGARASNGLLAQVLARSSPDRRVVLLAGPTRRFAALCASVRGAAIEVRRDTLATASLPSTSFADAVVLTGALSDVGRREQEALIVRALAALKPGGTFVVREVDASARLRSRVSLSVERAGRILDGRRPAAGAIRTAGAWVAVLADFGLEDAHVVPRRPASLDGRCTVAGRKPAVGPVGLASSATGDRRAPAARDVTGWAYPVRGCALCGSLRRRVEMRHRDGTLLRCRDCGLVSVDPLPGRATVMAQYDASYFCGCGYRDYAAEEHNFRATFRRRLHRLREFRARGRLLDVGAATGAFLQEARAAGFDAVGIEPSEAAARAARAAWLDVRTASIETADLRGARFDVVTCFDVVEHLIDPVGGLRRLAGWAREGGLVAVTVPDYGGWWARLSGRQWPFVTPKEHLHYFTRRTIRAAMEAAGLSVLEVSLAATPVSFGSLALRLPGAMGETVEDLLGRLADRGTALPFGSLLAVARR